MLIPSRSGRSRLAIGAVGLMALGLASCSEGALPTMVGFGPNPALPAPKGHYRFRFAFAPGEAAIWINHYDSQRLILSTSLIGSAKPMNSARLLFCFLRYPLVTLKVVALIHYQAAKLFLKGMRHFRKPMPPVSHISR